MAALTFTLFIAVVVTVLELNICKPTSAVPQTLIFVQNTVKELHCSSSSVIPKWNISGGMVPGGYTQAEFLEEVLSIEIKIHFNAANIQSGITSTLCINGSETNNGVTLQCIVGQDVIIDVTVMVQGVLSPPIIVDSITNSTAIVLRWNPPFTLDIPDMDPDIIGYTVYCRNLGTGMTEAVDVNEPEFSFTGMQGEVPDPCHEYEFRVSAWNVVGESENSTVLQTCFRGAIIPVPQPVNATTEVNSSATMMNVHFTVTIVDISCHGRRPGSIDVAITVDGRVMPIYTHEIEYGEMKFKIQDLPTGNFCSASVTARNQIGTSQPTDVILDCHVDQLLKEDSVTTAIPDQAVNLGAIVGGVVGGVLLLMLVLAVMATGIAVYKWKTKDPEMKRNPAYEIHNIRRPSRNVTSSVHTITGSGREGVQPSAGDGVSVERHLSDNEAFNTELNIAYGTVN